jgi:hypothetical protein
MLAERFFRVKAQWNPEYFGSILSTMLQKAKEIYHEQGGVPSRVES